MTSRAAFLKDLPYPDLMKQRLRMFELFELVKARLVAAKRTGV